MTIFVDKTLYYFNKEELKKFIDNIEELWKYKKFINNLIDKNPTICFLYENDGL